MDWVLKIISLLTAYILGSIPTSIWVGKIFYHIDIREHGSGNAGATNTFRVMGARAGFPVFF
ncbi:MAG: glycerol-3-phosphate acyltransferase, partial [Rikenellaceae bacterium]|nr:glycerol-3-phosphate acyltransferase [Rikenellaceae bacterium]